MVDVSQTPYRDANNNFVIKRSVKKGFVVFKSKKCGIKVGFYGRGLDSVATVVTSPRYSTQMTGLCGDCDGRKPDDLLTKNGRKIPANKRRFYEISKSFVVG